MFQIVNYIFIDGTDFKTVSIFRWLGLIVCVLFRPPRYFLTTFCPIHFIENSILLSNALSSVIGNYRLYWQSHHYFSIAHTRFRIDDDKRYNRKKSRVIHVTRNIRQNIGKRDIFHFKVYLSKSNQPAVLFSLHTICIPLLRYFYISGFYIFLSMLSWWWQGIS